MAYPVTIIKDLHLLELNDTELENIGVWANHEKEDRCISYKILQVKEFYASIQAEQKKMAKKRITSKKNKIEYFSEEELIQRTKEYFDTYVKEKEIRVVAKIFQESPASSVTFKWIKRQMKKNKLKLNDIALDTGIDKTQLSSLITGKRELSQPMKALFYYYFLMKDRSFDTRR